MHPLRENLKSVLSFNKRERRGAFVLITIVMLIWLKPRMESIFFSPDQNELHGINVEMRTYYATIEQETPYIEKELAVKNKVNLFDFDPNTASQQQFIALGFPEYLAERIEKYRNAGGKFFKAEDLKMIYGIKDELFETVQSYIVIKDISENSRKRSNEKNRPGEAVAIDLNQADSNQLMHLRGIGPVLASRIIRYRNLLGGFVNTNQLLEVYGISDSLYENINTKIKLNDQQALSTISVNKADIKTLQKHPYLRNYNLVNLIVKYRQAHGAFQSLEELKQIKLINDSIYIRISPYLSVE